MKEIGLILTAAALFCVLVFGAAWLAAAWMTPGPGNRRRPGGRKRKNRHG